MLSIKYFLQNFLVVKVVFHSFDFLIVFVPFSGNEYHVPFFCKHAGRADRFFPVGDAERFSHIFRIQSGKHIVDNLLWLFKTRIVRCDNHPVTGFRCFLCHDGAFPLIAVAAGTYYGDHFSFAFEYSMNGVQYIHQRVRSMCIVNDGRYPFRRTDGIETSGYRMERTERKKYIFLFFAQ